MTLKHFAVQSDTNHIFLIESKSHVIGNTEWNVYLTGKPFKVYALLSIDFVQSLISQTWKTTGSKPSQQSAISSLYHNERGIAEAAQKGQATIGSQIKNINEFQDKIILAAYNNESWLDTPPIKFIIHLQ